MARSPYARVSDVQDGFAEMAAKIKALPVGGDMIKANNLSDLPDKPAARDNLDVYSRPEVDAAIAAGGGGGSTGDVVGPAVSVDGGLVAFDGTSGKLLKAGPAVGVAAPGDLLRRQDGDGRFLGTNTRGVPFGVAGLDADGKLSTSVLPALALTDIFEAANQAAMLALVAQVGDIAIRTDQNKTYALAAEPASTLANWKELRTPTDVVQSVAGLTGAITAAALKAALTLVKGDVGLGNVDNTSDANKPVSTAQQTALDLKANINDTIVSVTSSRDLTASDNGKVLEVNSASAITLTVPSTLGALFNCIVTQIGAGQVTVAAGAGASVNAFGGAKTAGQWAELSVRVRGSAGAAAVSGGVA